MRHRATSRKCGRDRQGGVRQDLAAWQSCTRAEESGRRYRLRAIRRVKSAKDKRTLAILAPTNKAAKCCCACRGWPATTIHRILYTPVYDPEYERIGRMPGGHW